MNSELREPITETNYAPPRPLWYHATLRAEDAAQVLSQRQAGSYLVRKSPTSPDSYRLSVVDSNNVSKNHVTIHKIFFTIKSLVSNESYVSFRLTKDKYFLMFNIFSYSQTYTSPLLIGRVTNSMVSKIHLYPQTTKVNTTFRKWFILQLKSNTVWYYSVLNHSPHWNHSFRILPQRANYFMIVL